VTGRLGLQAHSFELEEDTSAYGSYVRGGIVTQHKPSKTLSFKPLGDALAAPGEFLFSDFSKLERPGLLHLGFQALDAFQVGTAHCCSMPTHSA
jgi:ubiquitin-activating enzyme E1